MYKLISIITLIVFCLLGSSNCDQSIVFNSQCKFTQSPPVQLAFKVGFNLTFIEFNPTIQHNVTVAATETNQISIVPCIIISNSTDWLYCETTYAIATGDYNVTVENDFNSQSTIITFNQTYPLGTAFSYVDVDQASLSINGYFGENGLHNVSVLNAIFVPPPAPYTYNITNTTSPFCTNVAKNCYGNGECSEKFQVCWCNSDIKETTAIINETKPVASFDIDGAEFKFEIMSIQELDWDESIIKELPTDQWQSTVNETLHHLTTVDYIFDTFNNTVVGPKTEISATISFAPYFRSIAVGNKFPMDVDINQYAVKMSVNVSGWEFKSTETYLRVVFQTEINNNQSFSYDCKENTYVDTFSFDSMNTTLQYMRVIKGVLSITPNSDTTSIATIGIVIGHCDQCVLDPDFTPLQITYDCKTVNWRLIVGLVVGGVAAIAIITLSIILIKRHKNRQDPERQPLNIN
ncbi:hypothetical protein DFA_09589 [Cavenderia fasciculata]|uniref:Uncharacterized protein n=1 Tax=Cavenderia fasciculata TaxID=261658 RepID=F4Q818_CACFS|nr:uncharacterized protein DFA_09589 [Cavenderia fasciculata]EGG15918.1 hypothetical protein DFA_09589 [Cavenderia fasciculata]|eukprot:XP_004352243.1 hypothetical protein DFA_09589 [Cavenderia fasciculata]